MNTIILLFGFIALAISTNRADEYDQIIALVQAGSTPAQLLADKIDAHIFSVRQEQEQHELIVQVQKGVCDEEITFRQKEIADALDALTKAQWQRKRCYTALQLAKGDIAVFTRWSRLFKEDLDFIRLKRESEKASFDRKVQNINYALETIALARPMIDTWEQNQSSFIEIKSHFNKLFIQMSKTGLAGNLNQLFDVLSQTSENELAERLRGILDTIEEKINVALASLVDEENQSIVEYNDRRTRTIQVIDSIQILLDHLNQYAKELERCLKREEGIINAATSKKLRNQNMLDYGVGMCSSFAEQYREASKTRIDQINTLQKLRKFILSKADKFGTFEGGEIEFVFSGKKEASFVQLSANMKHL